MARKASSPAARDTSHLLTGFDKDGFTPPDGYVNTGGHHHATAFTSTRSAIYRGKQIEVRTTYEITVDSEPLRVHTIVLDDGTVHCHGLPNYSFGSALDMVRALIDATPLAAVDRNDLGAAAHKSASKVKSKSNEKRKPARTRGGQGGHH